MMEEMYLQKAFQADETTINHQAHYLLSPIINRTNYALTDVLLLSVALFPLHVNSQQSFRRAVVRQVNRIKKKEKTSIGSRSVLSLDVTLLGCCTAVFHTHTLLY